LESKKYLTLLTSSFKGLYYLLYTALELSITDENVEFEDLSAFCNDSDKNPMCELLKNFFRIGMTFGEVITSNEVLSYFLSNR